MAIQVIPVPEVFVNFTKRFLTVNSVPFLRWWVFSPLLIIMIITAMINKTAAQGKDN